MFGQTLHISADRIWNVDGVRPDISDQVVRHLGQADGWQPGMTPVAIVRGRGHPSHVKINGWPYVYTTTITDGPETGNTLYQSY